MSPKRQVSPRHCPWMVRLVPHPGSEPQRAGKGQVSPLSVPPTHSLHCMSEHGPCVGYLSPEPGGKHASRCRGRSTWSSVLLPVRAGSPWTIPHSTYQPPLGHTFPPDASHSAPSVPTWGTFLNFILNTHGHRTSPPRSSGLVRSHQQPLAGSLSVCEPAGRAGHRHRACGLLQTLEKTWSVAFLTFLVAESLCQALPSLWRASV